MPSRQAQGVAGKFRHVYPESGAPRVWRAPGRVNLIGEHTDYNLGFVLPMAIDLACFVAAAPNADGCLRVRSEQLDGVGECCIGDLARAKPRSHWSDRAIGVAWELHRRGIPVHPQNVFLSSTVPLGGGLSSSAAMGVSLALALGGPRPPRELAGIAYAAERHFAGVPCGIMDQFAAACGDAILLDCRSLEWRTVKLPEELAIVTANTMVRHEHSDGGYRTRVQECAEAARVIGVASLRDAQLDDLEMLDGVLLRRARHVIAEDARVGRFVAASERGDLDEMGRLANQSHSSLRDDYEVSCAELDFLVEAAREVPGVVGARMTGGGFGGSTVNFVRSEAIGELERHLAQRHKAKWGIDPEIHRCMPSPGASPVFE